MLKFIIGAAGSFNKAVIASKLASEGRYEELRTLYSLHN